MTFTDATHQYESWLTAVLPAPLVRPDLDHKYRLLADPVDPFPFFRGTYYRWAQLWASAGTVADAPRVLAVGDLHVANFGTWRDVDGRLCWGVNDFDEADDLPYTNDLVRLAASVRFARKSGALTIKLADACNAILTGYRGCMDRSDGRPFVLEERHPHLRALAVAADHDPVTFWEKMAKLAAGPAAVPPPEARVALEAALPDAGLKIEFRARQAGIGSLGRARYVALTEWRGGQVCREAKAAAPPATAWATGAATACRAGETAGRALRAPDPFYHLADRWILRRLGPRTSRIELAELKAADLGRVLEAMGAETANVHLGTTGARDAVRADLAQRPGGWLLDAAKSLSDLLEADWAAWRSVGPVREAGPPAGP